jgi:phosphatidylglycerophosphate synthase
MFDGAIRAQIDPALDRLSRMIAGAGVSANSVTLFGFGLGLVAAASIASQHFLLGAMFIAISRLCDGLDGGVAKINGKTDLGGFLDIVLDFAFYGIIPVAFAFANPQENALAAIVLIFSFYVNGASFLAYAIMAEKRGLMTTARGEKSLFFTTGLAEASETIAVFLIACLVPAWFPILAWLFSAICLYTALVRILLAYEQLS